MFGLEAKTFTRADFSGAMFRVLNSTLPSIVIFWTVIVQFLPVFKTFCCDTAMLAHLPTSVPLHNVLFLQYDSHVVKIALCMLQNYKM